MQELMRHSAIAGDGNHQCTRTLFPAVALCLLGTFLCLRRHGVIFLSACFKMAGTTRLELATSAVTESLADVTYWNLTVLTARS